VESSDDQALLGLIPALIFTGRPDGTWEYISPPLCAYTGHPAEALTGLGWASALHADDQARSLNRWQAATTSGTPWEVEHRLRGADGAYRWFRTQCVPRHDTLGALTGWIGIVVPLESEYQLEAERAARQRAELEREVSDSAIAAVAHELRAPLTVLLGQARLLQRRLDANAGAEPRDRHTAEVLVEQAQRLARLLSALLDTALIDHGQLRISPTALDLGALVGRMVETLQPTLPAHTLHLHTDSEPLWVTGDTLRLEQVLQNVLQNAVKYSPAGGAIQVTTAAHGLEARISVSDQGIGIPASAQASLFQRFARAPEAVGQAVPGLGLGLYLSKGIMDLHGGSIDVRSIEGAGCTVTLHLPRLPLAPLSDRHDLSLSEDNQAHVPVCS
jgi:PAS domain S-box-containing protein